MKKILIIFIITLISLQLYAFDFIDDSGMNNFPGKFYFEFTNDFEVDTVGKELMINYGWSDLYINSKAVFGLKFPIEFYTVFPFISDFIEFPLDYDENKFVFNFKNNFLTGVNNTFSIEDVMDIGINAEFQLNSCIGVNPNTDENDKLEIMISPNILLAGDYYFGLSWEISQYFKFYLYPNNSIIFQFTDIEGTYNISYDFLHFFAPENIEGGVYAEAYLLFRLYNYSMDSVNELSNFDPEIGFYFNIYGFSPLAAFFVHIEKYFDQDNSDDDVWLGFKTSLSYKKLWFELNITYYGTISYKQGSEWQNHIETSLSFKLE